MATSRHLILGATSLLILLALLAQFTFADHQSFQGLKPDPEIQRIVAKVKSTEFTRHVQVLQSYGSRYENTPGNRMAAEYIYNQLHSLGLSVHYQSLPAGWTSKNVVAVQPGKSDPSRILVLGAHYDSYTESSAPGADDDASGVSAVLEAAHVLSQYDLDFTIHYVAFAAEEGSGQGGRSYAHLAREQGKKIMGVIDLDMIAYADVVPEDLDIFSVPRCAWLGSVFASAARTYALPAQHHVVETHPPGSDEISFWREGFPAVLAIEDYPLTNRFWHTPADTLDTLNIPFATQSTRAATAVAALMAQPYDFALPKPPAGISLSVVNASTGKRIVVSWNRRGAPVIGYNIYRSRSSHRDYKKQNPELITKTGYTDLHPDSSSSNFYVVTSIAADGRESHHSAEVNDIP